MAAKYHEPVQQEAAGEVASAQVGSGTRSSPPHRAPTCFAKDGAERMLKCWQLKTQLLSDLTAPKLAPHNLFDAIRPVVSLQALFAFHQYSINGLFK